MKIFSILIYLFIIASLNANELHWVDEQIKAIKPPRIGLKSSNLAKIKDPFVFTKSTAAIKKKSSSRKVTHASSHRKRYSLKRLHLSMTMNKSAKINNKWYKIGDKIHGYTILDVQLSDVTLKYYKKHYLLSTYSKKIVNFKN